MRTIAVSSMMRFIEAGVNCFEVVMRLLQMSTKRRNLCCESEVFIAVLQLFFVGLLIATE